MKSRYSVKYFPFAPGIPWEVQNGKYIMPKINSDIWQTTMQDKNAVVVSHGGLLEAFYSLTILEGLHYENRQRKLYWSNCDGFNYIYDVNALATQGPNLKLDDIIKYPSPLFFSANDNNIYFNSNCNYINYTSINGLNKKPNNKPVVKQIFSNSLLDWQFDFIPKLRYLDKLEGDNFKNWFNSYGSLRSNSKFVLIFPHNTNVSIHNINCLNWTVLQVKEFAALLRGLGLSLVICADNSFRKYYYNTLIHFANLNIALTLISKSTAILANEIDYLMIAGCVGKNVVISNNLSKPYNLYDNFEFINSDNVIFTSEDLTPLEAYTLIKGM